MDFLAAELNSTIVSSIMFNGFDRFAKLNDS